MLEGRWICWRIWKPLAAVFRAGAAQGLRRSHGVQNWNQTNSFTIDHSPTVWRCRFADVKSRPLDGTDAPFNAPSKGTDGRKE